MHRLSLHALSLLTGLALTCTPAIAKQAELSSPPMGWNSYNCFGAAVNEAEVKGNADIMAAHLKRVGWEYVVVDYLWYYPYPAHMNNCPQTADFSPALPMDAYGRLLPAQDRFPSAADGQGFKPLADYIHAKGLKFGIHLMRGIPREAVAKKLPIKGTPYTADQIANTQSTCGWLNLMYGLNMEHPGAQAYLDSLFELYTEWGVDFVKIDDLQGGFHSDRYYAAEVEGYRKAINKSPRPIVFSASPGHNFEASDGHVNIHTDMWRISPDFWDYWAVLKGQFAHLHQWEHRIGDGSFPDADMIPFGVLNQKGPHDGPAYYTKFTKTEQQTLISLWAIARSPLMYGGDLRKMRNHELRLLTNEPILTINQHSRNNRQFQRHGDEVVWIADAPEGKTRYLAFFNLQDESDAEISISLTELGFSGTVEVQDLWNASSIGSHQNQLSVSVPPHGSVVLALSATNAPSH